MKIKLIIVGVLVLLTGSVRMVLSMEEIFLITPGTTLEITVYKEKELSKKYQVDSGGFVDIPLVGKVEVGSMSIPQATEKIEEELRRFIKDPQVNIYTEGYGNVYVLGEVVKPGPTLLSGKMAVLDVVGMAGGLKPTASANRIKVVRKEAGGSRVIKVKLKKVMRGHLDKDVLLNPGDVIIVPERVF